MPAAHLVRPLEAPFQDVIDAVLRKRHAPTTQDVAALGPRVSALSQAYNAGLAGDGARVKVPLEARIAFSFARDVPKGAGAVRELVQAGALAATGERTLRIVDLGAGLGAMTWGIARALAAAAKASGQPPARIEALLVDEDAEALGAAAVLATEALARLGAEAPPLTIRTRVERLAPGMKLPEADLLVLGQVLSELDVALDPAVRVARHAALVADLLERVVAPDGSLVIVEPALRERTRHLHAVRDRLVAAGTTVFAPCLHAQGCPMLTTEGEWCHEDLPVDLPPWVVPLARAAGLRWQRLTFSHLVLRRDGRRLVDQAASRPAPEGAKRLHLRVVSELLRTKGKAEIFACTAEGARVRMRRLDRDATAAGPGAAATAAWGALGRGDVVTLQGTATIDDRGRVDATAEIDVWPTGK
ncbi:MAG TPA: small ribosomal subunit Rsm22 family protein [Labilithrix sp.]|nr:small ribosomal subunit Rsm22 family protein [Labilithrix sp.]